MPPGALDCWVFLSCLEVLQRIEGCCDRAHLDANSAHTVGLWSYATEKVTAPDARVALPVGRAPRGQTQSAVWGSVCSVSPQSPRGRFWLLEGVSSSRGDSVVPCQHRRAQQRASTCSRCRRRGRVPAAGGGARRGRSAERVEGQRGSRLSDPR